MLITVTSEDDETYWADINTKLASADQLTGIRRGTKIKKDRLEAALKGSLFQYTPSIFPPAVHYVSSDSRVLIWERPPCFKTVSYTQSNMANAEYEQVDKNLYRIPIPWQVYVAFLSKDMRIVGLRMFFRNQRLSYEDNNLAYPYLPNFYSDSSLCKASLRSVAEYPPTVAGVIQAGIDMVWNTGFNDDLTQALFHGYNNCAIPLFQLAKSGGNLKFGTLLLYLKNVSLETVVSWDYSAYAYLSDTMSVCNINANEQLQSQLAQGSLVALCNALQDASA